MPMLKPLRGYHSLNNNDLLVAFDVYELAYGEKDEVPNDIYKKSIRIENEILRRLGSEFAAPLNKPGRFPKMRLQSLDSSDYNKFKETFASEDDETVLQYLKLVTYEHATSTSEILAVERKFLRSELEKRLKENDPAYLNAQHEKHVQSLSNEELIRTLDEPSEESTELKPFAAEEILRRLTNIATDAQQPLPERNIWELKARVTYLTDELKETTTELINRLEEN